MPAAVFPQGRGRERGGAAYRRPPGDHDRRGAAADAGGNGARRAGVLSGPDGAAGVDVPVLRRPGAAAFRGSAATGRAVPRAPGRARDRRAGADLQRDRKSTRLNSSHANISYAVFCLKKKKNKRNNITTKERNT